LDPGGAPPPGGSDRIPASGLAEAWTRDALLEHASVASFGRFALELLGAGAPPSLVADAHRAALDEVQHARLCFGLASAYAGEDIGPGAFDFGRGVAVEADLADIAVRTFLEGCAGETFGAVLAAEALAAATDPAVRAVLAVIAEDEARHAELAWRAVAWAVEAGGAPVREALRDALDAHGRLDAAAVRATIERTLREVVLPCAHGLLAGEPAREPERAPLSC
jgi:hypothetical protein